MSKTDEINQYLYKTGGLKVSEPTVSCIDNL